MTTLRVSRVAWPSAMVLLDSIRPLTRIQAASFYDRHWDADLASLVARLFGDDGVLRQLDTLESRLTIAWQRLLAFAGMR